MPGIMLDNMQRLRGELAPVDVADFCGLQRFIETGYESDQDRKSTRLNSSHRR